MAVHIPFCRGHQAVQPSRATSSAASTVMARCFSNDGQIVSLNGSSSGSSWSNLYKQQQQQHHQHKCLCGSSSIRASSSSRLSKSCHQQEAKLNVAVINTCDVVSSNKQMAVAALTRGAAYVDVTFAIQEMLDEGKLGVHGGEVGLKKALNPKKKIPFALKEKKMLSHNTRLFRFALQSPEHQLGLPIGQHMFFYCKVNLLTFTSAL